MRILGWLAVLALIGAVFVAGVGLGEALHDAPAPARSQTIVRTEEPLPAPRISTETVTVTTSGQ